MEKQKQVSSNPKKMETKKQNLKMKVNLKSLNKFIKKQRKNIKVKP